MELIPKLLTEPPEGEHIFSASQVKLWNSCKFCWTAKYLDGIERQSSFAAERGKALHTLLENYLKDGTLIDYESKYGKMVLSGIEHLPAPGIATVEEAFHLRINEINFRGFIDFSYVNNGLVICGDHKTTKNFKYSLTEDQLRKDVQANLYALYLCTKHGVEELELNWVYYRTTGNPISKVVRLQLTKEEILQTLESVVLSCQEMLKAKEEGKTARDFQDVTDSCTAFGGCISKEYGKMTEPKLSLKEKLELAKKQSAPPPENKEPDTPAPDKELPEKIEIGIIEGFTLLVDAAEVSGNGKVVMLVDLLKPVMKKIAKEYNVSHYKFIQYDAVPAIATALDSHLTKNPIKPGTYVSTSTATAEGRDTLTVLEHHATFVIKGTK